MKRRGSAATAIKRKKPSRPAQAIAKAYPLRGRLLDYGCGFGRDVAFYKKKGFKAAGFDPNFLQWATTKGTEFHIVVMNYVLNVLPLPSRRQLAVIAAADHLKVGGHLVMVVRSPGEIIRAANKGSWQSFSDGFISSVSKNTFQRGLSVAELHELGYEAGLVRGPLTLNLPDAEYAIMIKPSAHRSNTRK